MKIFRVEEASASDMLDTLEGSPDAVQRSWARLDAAKLTRGTAFRRSSQTSVPSMPAELIQTIRRIGPRLRSIVGNPDECICVLVDASGIMAAFDGGESITRRMAAHGWQSRMSFLETYAGTNAIDLSLREREAAITTGQHHRIDVLGDVTIIAYPLLSRHGELFGSVGLLIREGHDRRHAQAVTSLSAMMLELLLQLEISNSDHARLFAEQRAIADAMKDGMMVVSRKGVVEYMNAPAGRILKVEPERSIGQRLADVLGFEPIIGPIFESGVGYADEEVRIKNRMADLHLVDTAVPIKDSAGRVVSVVNTFREFGTVAKVAHKFGGNQAHYTFDTIIGQSAAIRSAIALARKAALSRSNVLISGESGTGKELFAQGIHLASNRASGPFVAVNCAALPRDLIEAELFGYMPGSFTGAHKGGRPGKFEIASGGTIFLDEVSEMPIDVQAKLLRVLQEREITRVGGVDAMPVDVRVVAAMNRNVHELILSRHFREDLYYRLNVIEINVPALRDREGDIALLAEHYVRTYATALQKPAQAIAGPVLERLERYAWPGNVRELQNVMERMVNFSDDLVIGQAADLPQQKFGAAAQNPGPIRVSSLADMERQAVTNALAQSRYNVTKAAELLDTTKPRLYRMIRRYGIKLERGYSG